jgi:hypothetical protein
MDLMLVRLGDVEEDPGQKLQGVDEGFVLELVFCFWLVEH